MRRRAAGLWRSLGAGALIGCAGSALAQVAPPPAAEPAASAAASGAQQVEIVGQSDRSGLLPKPYAGGQVARGSRQGMLGNADVFDTPFSTKAYTAQLIRDQGARNVNDIVANDASIRTSLSATGPLDQSSIRGFVSYGDAYLFDGVQGLVGYSSIAVQNYERVEVFKGPAAALSGAGAYGTGVGGGFNLVPKRGTDVPVRSATVSVVDGALYGAQVDLGQRFGVDGVFGARLNLTAEDGEFYNDAQRRLVAPLLALDFRTDRVRLVLDAGSVRYRTAAGFANRQLAAGAALPAVPDPKVNPNVEWDALELSQRFGLVTGEWDVSDRWTVYARYGRFHEEPSKRIGASTSPLASDGSYTITGYSSYLWEQDNEVSHLGTRADLRWGGVKHLLAVSATRDHWRYHNERYLEAEYPAPIAGSIYTRPTAPNPFTGGVPAVEGVDYAPTVLESIALADTVTVLDDRLRVTLALRRQTIEAQPYKASRTTPTAAVLYKLGGGLSAYANYAEALSQGEQAPVESRNPGETLPPYVSKQREVGLKWDRGSHGITAAVFDIRKGFGLLDLDGFFRAGGEQRNRGVELDTFGEPARGLRVLGGVALIDGKQSSTPGGTFDGKRALGVPRFTANLGAEWDVPAVSGLTVTGRVIHTGSAYVDSANTQVVPQWSTLDLGTRWRFERPGLATTLRLGIDNVFDDRHWTVGGRNFVSVAPPRTWKVSASFDL